MPHERLTADEIWKRLKNDYNMTHRTETYTLKQQVEKMTHMNREQQEREFEFLYQDQTFHNPEK